MGMSGYIKKIRNSVGHSLLQMPSVTIINFDDEGRLLLVHNRDSGQWVLPGGAIEPGETPADAAAREMWEETGLVVELMSIHGVYGGPDYIIEYSNGDRTSYVTIVFKSRTVGGEPGPKDDECVEVGYFSRDEISNLDTAHWVDVLLPDIFEQNDTTLYDRASWKPA